MKTIEIFWWKWQHASNLIDRWIFNGLSQNIIEKDEESHSKIWNSAVIIWISETSEIINKIFKQKDLESDLINFSGIMSTTPEKIRNQKWVSNFHFLFWPKATQNLKVIFAWDLSETSKSILDNTRKQSIQIIESDIETHDSKMAVTQALTHLFIFLTWLSNSSNKHELINEWNTPNNTIGDMIFENEFFKNIILNMTLRNNLSKTFLNTVSDNLTSSDIENFWTPTFWRVMNFAQKNNVIINDDIVNLFDEKILQKSLFIEKIEELKRTTSL